MDLRPYLRDKPELLNKGVELIKSSHLFYQPFILSDDIEVGEGRNMCESYADVNSVFDLNVYAPNLDLGSRKKAQDLPQFRRYNEEYRSIYNYITSVICKQFNGDISNLSFAEIGTNTGLNLFNLALNGAKKCYGYDWNDMTPVFDWLNQVLDTNVQFTQSNYNNLYHRLDNLIDAPEVDVMINTVFTNHQFVFRNRRRRVHFLSLFLPTCPDNRKF